MRRGLEREIRGFLNGDEGGNAGHSQGTSYGFTRQRSTLPDPKLREKYYKYIYEPQRPALHHRSRNCRSALFWSATDFLPYDPYEIRYYGRCARHPRWRRAGFYHGITRSPEFLCHQGKRLDHHVWMRRARQRPPLTCRMQRDIYGSHKRTARGDVLDDQQRWRGAYAIWSTQLHATFRVKTTSAKQGVLVTHYGCRGQSLCTESHQPI